MSAYESFLKKSLRWDTFSFHLVATMARNMLEKLCTRLADLLSVSATLYTCMNACRPTRFFQGNSVR